MQNLTARFIAWLGLLIHPSGRHRADAGRSGAVPLIPATIPHDPPTMELPPAEPPTIRNDAPPHAEYADLEGLDEVSDEERAYWLTVLEQSAQVRERAAARRG
ncbi:hypothetical protein [Streptomyces sp. PT12]|uniref:hypothetical protein n=1 Tax=Streptomyces sp. PT12 TaxID=1510197 RepID=UPI0011BD7B9B|nr:hypothetical protein [Streptomyces sp. PT12]